MTLLAAPGVDVPRVLDRLWDAGVAVEGLAGFYVSSRRRTDSSSDTA